MHALSHKGRDGAGDESTGGDFAIFPENTNAVVFIGSPHDQILRAVTLGVGKSSQGWTTSNVMSCIVSSQCASGR